jgi:hypothetical protein
MSFPAGIEGDPILEGKIAFFERFWRGEGPYPIIFARPHLAKGRNWTRRNLIEQHGDPDALFEEALAQTIRWTADIDDGVPMARADLGTTLLPSALGLGIHVEANAHPWLADHLDLEALAERIDTPAITDFAAAPGRELRLAREFYASLLGRRAAGIPPRILPYLPDTQGVFDLCHIVVGSSIFYDFLDRPGLLHRAMETSLALHLAGTAYFKGLLGETRDSMLHGHGMPSGVWFPDTGARISEDSCTLLSPAHLRAFCLPYLERITETYPSLFLHFCGRHEDFLALMANRPWISTLNLGNPELYDLEDLFGLCGRTGTVYFGHFGKGRRESHEAYLERMAGLAQRHGAGLILVAPPVAEKERCRRLRELWHELTADLRFERSAR